MAAKNDSMESSKDSVRLMLAYLCVSQDPNASIEKRVNILDRFGLTDAEIASVCDCATQSVRNARQKNKRTAKKT